MLHYNGRVAGPVTVTPNGDGSVAIAPVPYGDVPAEWWEKGMDAIRWIS
jgi:hypothetical protein